MIVLIDMDGVIANFEEGHRRMATAKGLPSEVINVAERREWDMLANIEEPYKTQVLQGWHEPGFFAGLKLIPGALKGLEDLQARGHEVFLCTAPLANHVTCAQEKLAWVEKYLGRDLVSRTIITKDKTLVQGSFLLDDRPDVTGVAQPTWEHILFDQPYNQNNKRKRRATWENFLRVITNGY